MMFSTTWQTILWGLFASFSVKAERPNITTPTGMTVREHDEMLDFWKTAWSQAGWEPVVLTPTTDASESVTWSQMLLQKWMAMEPRRMDV
jgi:hypothetical protein